MLRLNPGRSGLIAGPTGVTPGSPRSSSMPGARLGRGERRGAAGERWLRFAQRPVPVPGAASAPRPPGAAPRGHRGWRWLAPRSASSPTTRAVFATQPDPAGGSSCPVRACCSCSGRRSRLLAHRSRGPGARLPRGPPGRPHRVRRRGRRPVPPRRRVKNRTDLGSAVLVGGRGAGRRPWPRWLDLALRGRPGLLPPPPPRSPPSTSPCSSPPPTTVRSAAFESDPGAAAGRGRASPPGRRGDVRRVPRDVAARRAGRDRCRAVLPPNFAVLASGVRPGTGTPRPSRRTPCRRRFPALLTGRYRTGDTDVERRTRRTACHPARQHARTCTKGRRSARPFPTADHDARAPAICCRCRNLGEHVARARHDADASSRRRHVG